MTTFNKVIVPALETLQKVPLIKTQQFVFTLGFLHGLEERDTK